MAKIASLEVLRAARAHPSTADPTATLDQFISFELQIRTPEDASDPVDLIGSGPSLESAIADAVSQLCVRPIRVHHSRQRQQKDESFQWVVTICEATVNESADPKREGAGRYVSKSTDFGLAIATIRAANHAGLLKPIYRANHQKMLRQSSHELVEELTEVLGLGTLAEQKKLEADSVILDHLNRVASAAVVTAANSPKPESILSLYDTSTWLYDAQGRKRDSFTDTDLWFAWYPGIEQAGRTIDSVIASMPAAPASKIPWIVRLFENPQSWIRFRGAVDLEDHDVMHVLLGRGLQDQDEAFVLGFAMGTAKQVRWWEYHFFQFLIARLYPEPYRIPKFLHPAFRLGVQCGQETGNQNLYKSSLKNLRPLTVEDARREAGIDTDILRRYYREEQAAIPITIASLRL
ncbi:MAG: hypothetical protein SFV81_10400 [Pirellulaceae bacterium]|nr:hypothetical protein [Pirellulaceae bacterium]